MARSSTNIWIDGTQAGGTLKELESKVRLLNNEIKKLPINSEKYNAKVKELQATSNTLKTHRDQIKGIGDSFGSAKNSVANLTGKVLPMVGALGLVSAGIGVVSGAISSWYTNNKAMEKSLSSLQSLTGASTEDLKFYKEEALEMGKTSTVSAMQTVDAFRLIGSARPDLLKNKEALAAVTKEAIVLSEAAGMELGPSAESLAGFLNQFNLEGKESTRIINALAAGSKEGAAEVTDISLSLEKFGTVANSNNVTVEESIALTETLAEKNIKGAEAGTQLRNVLLNVATASALPKEAQDAMAKYGVNLEIVTNKALPLEVRLREMAKVQGDQNALVRIFGKENVVAGQTILQNVDKFAQLRDAVTGTNVAYEQQAINNDNLDGDLKKLGSAWEGLTLSMDGGSETFRGVVQVGTDMLNWTSDTIKAFKEMDGLKIETQFLKLADALTFGIGPLHDFLEEEIRFNELTISVIDGMKDQADSSTILTESLKQNNYAIKNGNLSAEESKRIQDENANIISKLNEQYPELTSNMDLNSASSEELSRLQKQINANLLQQSIAAVQAAESERILSEIVQNSMQIAEQRAKEKNRWAVTNWIADKFADDAQDMEANNEKLKKRLKDLPKTLKEVEKSLKDINPEFGTKFKEQSRVMNEASKEIQRIKKLLLNASGSEKKALEAELKAQKAVYNSFKDKNNELKKNAITQDETNEAINISDNKLTENKERNLKAQEEARKKHNDKIKKLQDDLNKIIEDAEKLRADFNREKRLDSLVDAQEKEIELLKNSIDDKYQAEIEAAQKLAKEKGDIGAKAQEQLNALLVLKDEELNYEKKKIADKFSKEKAEKDNKDLEEINKEALKKQESFEQSVVDLKVLKAQIAVKEASKKSKAEQDLANQELISALKEQLEHEKNIKIKALESDFVQNIISKEELDNRKKELELKYTQDVEEINKQSATKISEITKEKFDQAVNAIAEVVNVISQMYDVQFNNRVKQIDKEKKKELLALEEKHKKGLISEDDFQKQSAVINQNYDQQRRELENKKAKKDKEIALFQATIATALAVAKAVPVVPLMILAGVAGAAQIALIASQPVPQYAEGGWATVTGAKDGKKYNAKHIGRHPGGMTPSSPSLALISERGPEYFVPNHLLSTPAVANHVAAIEAIRTNQYADGGFTSQPSKGGVFSNNFGRLEALITQQSIILQSLSNQLPYLSVNIGDKDLQKMQTRNDELKKIVG